jgi:aquaporin Z
LAASTPETLDAQPQAAAPRPQGVPWPECLIEAACLGMFMISACAFGVLLEHPASALHQSIENPVVRRALMGLAMGLTAIGIIRSPWGQRSGAHMNPGVTFTYLTLGKIRARDAWFYVAFQFVGGIAGVLVAGLVIGSSLADAEVNYVVTLPGPLGLGAAFAAEAAISLVLMLTILFASNHRRLAKWTPMFAGTLVATYITLEAPISGMSMNPARTFASALGAQEWRALWIYFTAPPLGMLLAGAFYRLRRGANRVFCAKLYHHTNQRCIFRCNWGALKAHD